MNHIVLLSGGSGKRLWPFSGSTRPKQYIRFLADERTGEPCSMVQRVWSQLTRAGLVERCIVCSGEQQTALLHSQLGAVNIAEEPEGRDTFAAVALSCAYLSSRMGASEHDTLCVMPVDPYTDSSYYDTLRRMPRVLAESGAEVVLMGIRARSASESYGYLIPEKEENGYVTVKQFVEKPSEKEAQALIARGAMWNGGVFCMKLGPLLEDLRRIGLPSDYESLRQNYSRLPKISFDYKVLENCNHLAAVPFPGMWEDIGTWSAAARVLAPGWKNRGVTQVACRNLYAVNRTGIPVVAVGAENLILAVSGDGILIADARKDLPLKQAVETLPLRPSFEEKSWGTVSILDFSRESGTEYLVRKIRIRPGEQAEGKERAAGGLAVLQGNGFVLLSGGESLLAPGTCVSLPADQPFSLRAGGDGLVLVLTQQGEAGTFTHFCQTGKGTA